MDQLRHSYGNVDVSGNAYAMLGDVHNHYHTERNQSQNKYNLLYESLAFQGIHSRLRNIETPLPHTCQWIRSHPTFLSWKDHSRIAEHNGLLWIKGKPGSGKSTILKDTMRWAQKEWPGQPVLSYFFNARASTELERSCLGLYRSLIYQLLSAHDTLHSHFMNDFSAKEMTGRLEPWTEIELQNFLLRLIGECHLPHLNIFVDALDEGDYEDIWRMIMFFEKAADYSISVDTVFRLCLSSRHYPQINIESGLTVTLENSKGHAQAIELYIEKAFPAKNSPLLDEVKNSLLVKAEGIFLWVVLSISILRPLYSRRRVKEMKAQLDILPPGLYDLFFAIMTQTTENIDEFVTLLQWMLVRKRELNVNELYLGIQYRNDTSGWDEIEDCEDVSAVTTQILDYSRGFVELMQDSNAGVQFIHESVRQFLIPVGLNSEDSQSIKHSLYDFSLETCNSVVAEGCLRYLLQVLRGPPFSKVVIRKRALAHYAARYWWQHVQATGYRHNLSLMALANEVLAGDVDKLSKWAQIYDVYRDREDPYFWRNASNLCQHLYNIASTELSSLVSVAYPWCAAIDVEGAEFGAYVDRQGGLNENALHLLAQGSPTFLMMTTLQFIVGGARRDNALKARSFVGSMDWVHGLLYNGGRIYHTGGLKGDALLISLQNYYRLTDASSTGHWKMVRLLQDHGVSINAEGSLRGDAPRAALVCGHEQIVKLLLGWTMDVNARGGRFASVLGLAVAYGQFTIVQMLLDRGADINAPGTNLLAVFSRLALCGNIETLRFWLDMLEGLDWLDRDRAFRSAYHHAATIGRVKTVQLLLEYGPRFNIAERRSRSVLRVARQNGHQDIVDLLIGQQRQGPSCLSIARRSDGLKR